MNLRNLLAHLKPALSSTWVQVGLVTAGMTFGDAVWARYVRAIALAEPLEAAAWSVLVVLISAYVVISYVDDKRMLIPAAIGAFLGTYYGV